MVGIRVVGIMFHSVAWSGKRSGKPGRGGPGRANAQRSYFDEDALTLGLEAAQRCIEDNGKVGHRTWLILYLDFCPFSATILGEFYGRGL